MPLFKNERNRSTRGRIVLVVSFTTTLLISGVAFAATATNTKSSLPGRTSGDVSTLVSRENAVVTQLRAFSHLGKNASVTQWEKQLKTDESAQSSAESKLNSDLIVKSKSVGSGSTSSTLSFKDENGDAYSVDLVEVIDPAQGADQFTTPNAGDRFVAADFKITDTGKQATSDDANSTASIVGSDNQTYTADFDSVSGCTNFNSGEYQINPGQSATGCVVFQLPTTIKVSKVEWSPNGGFGGSFGTWNVK